MAKRISGLQKNFRRGEVAKSKKTLKAKIVGIPGSEFERLIQAGSHY
jgi:hypothetical protein